MALQALEQRVSGVAGGGDVEALRWQRSRHARASASSSVTTSTARRRAAGGTVADDGSMEAIWFDIGDMAEPDGAKGVPGENGGFRPDLAPAPASDQRA